MCYEVFQGAQRFISVKRPEMIVTELSPSRSRSFDPTGRRILQMLEMLAEHYKAHLLSWNRIKNPTWKVVKSSLSNDTFNGNPAELLRQCGISCMVLYTRSRW